MKRLQETIEAKPRPDVPRQLVIAFEAPQLWMMQPRENGRSFRQSLRTEVERLAAALDDGTAWTPYQAGGGETAAHAAQAGETK